MQRCETNVNMFHRMNHASIRRPTRRRQPVRQRFSTGLDLSDFAFSDTQSIDRSGTRAGTGTRTLCGRATPSSNSCMKVCSPSFFSTVGASKLFIVAPVYEGILLECRDTRDRRVSPDLESWTPSGSVGREGGRERSIETRSGLGMTRE